MSFITVGANARTTLLECRESPTHNPTITGKLSTNNDLSSVSSSSSSSALSSFRTYFVGFAAIHMSQVPECRISHNNCSSGQRRVLGLHFRSFRDNAVLRSITRILVLPIINITFLEIGENLEVQNINSRFTFH